MHMACLPHHLLRDLSWLRLLQYSAQEYLKAKLKKQLHVKTILPTHHWFFVKSAHKETTYIQSNFLVKLVKNSLSKKPFICWYGRNPQSASNGVKAIANSGLWLGSLYKSGLSLCNCSAWTFTDKKKLTFSFFVLLNDCSTEEWWGLYLVWMCLYWKSFING